MNGKGDEELFDNCIINECPLFALRVRARNASLSLQHRRLLLLLTARTSFLCVGV